MKNNRKQLFGKWSIYHMDDFDKKVIDMEVSAYLKIEKNGFGEFQFILVHGNMCGDFMTENDGEIFDFTWNGNDECDEAAGDGWFKTKDGKGGAGQIRFHCGDKHCFLAKKVIK